MVTVEIYTAFLRLRNYPNTWRPEEGGHDVTS